MKLPATPFDAMDQLTKQGYDRDAIWRFAKAQKSWEAKDTPEWQLWRAVEELSEDKEGER